MHHPDVLEKNRINVGYKDHQEYTPTSCLSASFTKNGRCALEATVKSSGVHKSKEVEAQTITIDDKSLKSRTDLSCSNTFQ